MRGQNMKTALYDRLGKAFQVPPVFADRKTWIMQYLGNLTF